ncbi:uncharacterized protein BCR38DRAFT_122405 [Pseudomassariella vexata]|uniref:Uncharacterized protein n=1 Tax=Pseudomassariella vexata TaxID=1141098 RepID=A0A1Y2D9K3_9PEZI|nr:uncharacterized protein BCR38DRAFT_122405 [Pseudomassariella vexata]ORY55943.1 hypothetical protein BCR38DRAFT_122405 [Pseudomassariella vexata]
MKRFLGGVAELETASEVFQCTEGTSLLFRDGWNRWPEDANKTGVLSWFAKSSKKLAGFADKYIPNSVYQRRPLAQPN